MAEQTAEQLAEIIDHTILVPETTWEQCRQFLLGAPSLAVRRVCISPTFVARASAEIDRARLPLEIVTVAGFPSGVHDPRVKVLEVERSVDEGASEIDFVANRGNIKASDWRAVGNEFHMMRDAAGTNVVKVILETATLTEREIAQSCEIARATGLDFVKTSTGFSASGGASVRAVTLMAETVGDSVGIKASGGIRSANFVRELRDAGATRFGISATASVLAEWQGSPLPAEPTETGY